MEYYNTVADADLDSTWAHYKENTSRLKNEEQNEKKGYLQAREHLLFSISYARRHTSQRWYGFTIISIFQEDVANPQKHDFAVFILLTIKTQYTMYRYATSIIGTQSYIITH